MLPTRFWAPLRIPCRDSQSGLLCQQKNGWTMTSPVGPVSIRCRRVHRDFLRRGPLARRTQERSSQWKTATPARALSFGLELGRSPAFEGRKSVATQTVSARTQCQGASGSLSATKKRPQFYTIRQDRAPPSNIEAGIRSDLTSAESSRSGTASTEATDAERRVVSVEPGPQGFTVSVSLATELFCPSFPVMRMV